MDWWMQGGVGMYVVLLMDVLAGGASLLALGLAIGAWFYRPLRLPAKILSILAIVLCIVPLVTGTASAAWSRHQVDEAIAGADPEQREIIRQVGYQEASAATTFGGGSTCCVLLPAILAAVIALAIPKTLAPDEDDR